jgi:hypothetical protein
LSRTRTTKRVSGRLALQPGGYRSFEPAPLPPEPPLDYDDELRSLLSAADRALGRLDGIATTLPNPNLFVAMYVRSEAVMSSQIEGSQATLADVLQFEVDHTAKKPTVDVAEVVNYVDAMNHGLARLDELPLSLRLIRENPRASDARRTWGRADTWGIPKVSKLDRRTWHKARGRVLRSSRARLHDRCVARSRKIPA